MQPFLDVRTRVVLGLGESGWQTLLGSGVLGMDSARYSTGSGACLEVDGHDSLHGSQAHGRLYMAVWCNLHTYGVIPTYQSIFERIVRI